jgi:hypothetical protein
MIVIYIKMSKQFFVLFSNETFEREISSARCQLLFSTALDIRTSIFYYWHICNLAHLIDHLAKEHKKLIFTSLTYIDNTDVEWQYTKYFATISSTQKLVLYTHENIGTLYFSWLGYQSCCQFVIVATNQSLKFIISVGNYVRAESYFLLRM